MADEEKKKIHDLVTKTLDEHELVWRLRDVGLWPDDVPVPEEPKAAQEERAEIEAELAELRKQSAKIADPDKALAQERVRRWHESKKRRALSKAEREAKAKARREEWKAERALTIVHAGDGVSAGLQNKQSDAALLARRGLPVLQDGADLAQAMGIELSALRWLTYHRRAAALLHYHRYGIPKKTGGIRAISAPKPALAKAQEWVLANVLNRLEPEPDAHGFVRRRSILTNALPHVARAVVVNLDLSGFFPTLTFRRVKGLFGKLGYSEHVSTVLALLTTEPPRARAELDGKVWGVALGERVLPQGACTSPALTNAICRRLDRRLRGLAALREERSIKKKDWIKQTLSLGQKMFLAGELEQRESISRPKLENALAALKDFDLVKLTSDTIEAGPALADEGALAAFEQRVTKYLS